MKNKTVYVLGAGFSIEAGAPLQSNVIDEIFKLHQSNPDVVKCQDIDKLKDFLSNSLYIQDELHSKIPLEDIFTPLDRCIADNINFRNLNISRVREIRELVYRLIGITLKYKLQNVEKGYINKFAKHLFNNCKERKDRQFNNVDNVSVLSTNWDILLDNSIKEIIRSNTEDAVVDYCCYISSYKEDDDTIKPGLEVLGRGGFNIKLLKLHGSYNWLQCPRCLRVYIEFDEKIAIEQYHRNMQCRHCKNNFRNETPPTLVSNLIMPTFLKDFSNPQYKLIWQNAGIELSEATKIVFIGYSLPQADFEMRQLLSRMIREDVEIEVVTKGAENEQSTKDLKERYNMFFGRREPKFFYDGVTHYINNILS